MPEGFYSCLRIIVMTNNTTHKQSNKMQHNITRLSLIAKKLSAMSLMGGMLLVGISAPAMAGHDDRDDDRRHWHRDEQCRPVVKEFKIGRGLRYTENGTVCRDRYGNWNMKTDTRFPQYTAEVFFDNRGRLVFAGYLNPIAEGRARSSGYICDRPMNAKNSGNYHNRGRGYDDRYEHWGDDRNYGYNDKKNHKNH
jgi:hypothetical protein